MLRHLQLLVFAVLEVGLEILNAEAAPRIRQLQIPSIDIQLLQVNSLGVQKGC